MAASANKLISCLGYAARLAAKIHVRADVHYHLLTALNGLRDVPCKSSGHNPAVCVAQDRKKICLMECLQFQSEVQVAVDQSCQTDVPVILAPESPTTEDLRRIHNTLSDQIQLLLSQCAEATHLLTESVSRGKQSDVIVCGLDTRVQELGSTLANMACPPCASSAATPGSQVHQDQSTYERSLVQRNESVDCELPSVSSKILGSDLQRLEHFSEQNMNTSTASPVAAMPLELLREHHHAQRMAVKAARRCARQARLNACQLDEPSM